MIDDIKLSELLVTKMCHDLSGPIGATNNGVELLKDANEQLYQKSVDLVEISAKEAVARLLFFRQAYGLVNQNSEVSFESLKKLSENFFIQKKIKVIWEERIDNPSARNGLHNDIGKLALNLMQVISLMLIQGGRINVFINDKNKKYQLEISGEGDVVKEDPQLVDLLTEPIREQQIDIDVKNVQAYLVVRLIERLDVKLTTKLSKNMVQMMVN